MLAELCSRHLISFLFGYFCSYLQSIFKVDPGSFHSILCLYVGLDFLLLLFSLSTALVVLGVALMLLEELLFNLG